MDGYKEKHIGDSKAGQTTQLFCCQLKTNFNVLQPALVPKKFKKTAKLFDSDNTPNRAKSQSLSTKHSNLLESPHVPDLNLVDCHGNETVTSSSRQDDSTERTDGKSSIVDDFSLPTFSAGVLSDLRETTDLAAKTLATITTVTEDFSQRQAEDTLSEDRVSVEETKGLMENSMGKLESLKEQVMSLVGTGNSTSKRYDMSDSVSKSSPYLCDSTVDSGKLEDDDEYMSLGPSCANLEAEQSDTIITATQRAMAHALIVKEVEKELECDSWRPQSPDQMEHLPFEGNLENFMNIAPASINTEDVMVMTDRLSQTYQMQMLMAQENKDLQQTSYVLQEELLAKETELERFQRMVETLQTEVRLLKRENSALQENKKSWDQVDEEARAACEAERAVGRKKMGAEMACLEGELQKLKVELSQLQTERQQLLIARQHAKSQMPLTLHPETYGSKQTLEHFELATENLRAAMEEVSSLKEKNKHLTVQIDQLTEQNRLLIDVEMQLRSAKSKNNQLIELTKQSEIEIEELAKSKTELEDELNDVRECLDESTGEAGEYRRKYLDAQQRVEELVTEINQKQKQLEIWKDESAAEIRLFKNQCQEKFSSVQHLPAVLNETQLKLQESQQLHAIAERSLDDMKREMVQVINENSILQKTLEAERNSRLLNSTERGKLTAQIVAAEEKCNELRNEANLLQTRLARLEDAKEQTERQLMEKTHEAAELRKLLESLRTDTTRQMSRTKDRAEAARRSMQVQVSNLERELAAARAAEKNAQKEKDEIRQKMQAEIDELTESLDEGQTRWRSLHAHVTSLQNSLQPGHMFKSQ